MSYVTAPLFAVVCLTSSLPTVDSELFRRWYSGRHIALIIIHLKRLTFSMVSMTWDPLAQSTIWLTFTAVHLLSIIRMCDLEMFTFRPSLPVRLETGLSCVFKFYRSVRHLALYLSVVWLTVTENSVFIKILELLMSTSHW